MSESRSMPREEGIDNSLSLLREGYLYILNRRKMFQSDSFETRLLAQKAVCLGGVKGAELFYDTDKFKRHGVVPNRVQETLLGKGGVQSLDGDEHRHRKAMFMSLMSRKELARMSDILKEKWEQAINKWEQQDSVLLYEESQEILCRMVCEWAGVPLKEEEVEKRTKQLVAMFESPAAVGPAHWQGRHARNQAEKWIEELVEQVRNQELNPPENTALYTFSWHRDLKGNLLEKEIAAVEVLNILRPTVAVSVYMTFCGLAIHQFPEKRKKMVTGDDRYRQWFVQEVRRFYPFFPLQAAEAKKEFEWEGYTYKKGTLTLLDIYGTNHDPNIWENPERFEPERFEGWTGDSPFAFIPQGGGDHLAGHRCAGEWMTIGIMNDCLEFLANRIEYDVPADQDLSYSLVSMPTIPTSHVILENVRRRRNPEE